MTTSRELRALHRDAEGCRACELWERATQVVIGEGPVPASLMLVGEQPGDQEDRAGRPFVGPAGRVLDDALEAAGIDRLTTFVTNVVKHFRWRPAAGGKRRLHERPKPRHVRACRPWLDRELGLVQPDVLVLMGAVAAGGVLGPDVRVTRDRGRPLESDLAPTVIVTVHPSSILRAPDEGAREVAFRAFVDDLVKARRLLEAAEAHHAPPRRDAVAVSRRRGSSRRTPPIPASRRGPGGG